MVSLLDCSIVIYDSGQTTASDVERAINKCNVLNATVSTVLYASGLKSRAEPGDIDVLFCNLSIRGGQEKTIGIIQELISKYQWLLTVYYEVNLESLLDLELVNAVSLIPVGMLNEENISHALQQLLTYRNRWLERPITVKSHNTTRVIQTSRIVYIESNLRKIRIHIGSEITELYGKLSDIMHILPNRFIQCHKSFAVNMGCVEKLDIDRIHLITDETVPVSQKRRKMTRPSIEQYVGKTT